jgi:hypothetical protein
MHGCARSTAKHPKDCKTVSPAGTAPANAVPPADAQYLAHTVPGQQIFAQEYLAGKVPGTQQRYAPNAKVSPTEGWVEDDETVARLVKFRQEFPYG